MILADKIIHLRKKYNMTQEELAEKLNVSRQSISKWEGSLSTPDLNKVIAMSKIFGVTTDYLLNDEISKEDVEGSDVSEEGWMSISLEMVNSYLRETKVYARNTALAVMTIILSVVPLIFLTSEVGRGFLSEDMADVIGVSLLFILVTASVGMLIWLNMTANPYKMIDSRPFELEYGVEGFLEKEREQYRPTFIKGIILGISMILLSLIPLIAIGTLYEDFMANNDGIVISVWLLIIALAVFLLVNTSIYWGTMESLLENSGKIPEEDNEGAVASVYWPIVVAIYLGYSFITNDWGRSWIIWPVAGVLFAAVSALANMFNRK